MRAVLSCLHVGARANKQPHPPPPSQQDGVVQYGADFLTELNPLWNGTEPSKHGGTITTCICHGCPWPDLTFGPENKTTYEVSGWVS